MGTSYSVSALYVSFWWLECLVKRIYLLSEDARGITIFSRKSTTSVSSMNCWEMKSIRPKLEN